jgi:cell fate (sporulation/competence/biofilm development) regulator YlbF (YheA/YmcA/DUF963 family)
MATGKEQPTQAPPKAVEVSYKKCLRYFETAKTSYEACREATYDIDKAKNPTEVNTQQWRRTMDKLMVRFQESTSELRSVLKTLG